MAPEQTSGSPPAFTLEDFQSGRVIEWLEGIQSSYQRTREEYVLRALAKELKFSGFPQMLKAYRDEMKKMNSISVQEDGVSEFADQALDLNTGEWAADESGIWRYDSNGRITYACSHPVMPVQLMRSIDTGLMKVTLAHRRSYNSKRPWSKITVPLSRVSKANDIVALVDCGISVTSGERAQALVDFLRDVLDRNQGVIPEVKSVSRMGWNEDGFSPYVGGVVFDSADAFRPVYEDLRQAGTLDGWLEEALEARAYSLPARVALAASFAAPLVEPTGCLPFFVHFWAVGSATGKSVTLMLGASVWGNPAINGGYVKSFKGTTVSFELTAGFLHSLPMFLDELQLSKDKKGRIAFNVYELAAGAGKGRANQNLGLNYTPKWDNCFITSGESPLTEETDGAGALNRVIEINCTSKKIFRDGRRTANRLKKNFGHAGKLFIEKLCQEGELDRVRELYENVYAECMQGETTEKQAMAAALILTADKLASDWIFHDNRALTVEEIGQFLRDEKEVSLVDRGYDYACGWISANSNQFAEEIRHGERFGVIDEENNLAIINRVVWNRMCEQAGFSSKALLSGLKERGLLVLGSKGYTKTKKLDGVPTNCVWLRLPVDGVEDGEGADELPL